MNSTLNTLRNNKKTALIVLLIISHAGWIKFEILEFIYPIDYLYRTLMILLCWYVYQFRKNDFIGWWQLFRLRNFYLIGLAASLILISSSIVHVIIYTNVPVGIWQWHYFPKIHDPGLKAFDLTIGLVLVALAEEIIYRKLMLEVLTLFDFQPVSIYLTSSLLFALLHINQSADTTATAFAAGIIFMYSYRASGTLWVPIVVHYLVNLYIFGIGLPFIREVQL